jgi:hypothetical protein
MRDPEEIRYQKKVPKKPFGIQSWSEYCQLWRGRRWYATEKARDQALADMQRKCEAVDLITVFRKVEK